MPRKPKVPPPVEQALEVHESPMPLEEMSERLRSLNLKPNEYGDFMKAVDVCVLLRQGQTWDQVSAAVGVPKRTLQWDRWQSLIRKAMTYLIDSETTQVRAAEAAALAEWTNIVNIQVHVAKHGKLDRDRIEAAKFLHEAIVSKVKEMPDVSSQKKYLEMMNMDPTKQSNQHAPMNVLHVIHHHQADDLPQEDDDADIIDAATGQVE